jgi:hypothetical protein
MIYPAVRLVPQINGLVVGAANCGPCTACMTVDFATGGRIRPTPLEIRRRMGVPYGPTDVQDQIRSVESYDDETVHVGLRPVDSTPHFDDDWEVVRTILLGREKWLGLVLDYGVVNDEAMKLSGDKVFRGLHFLGAFGARRLADGTYVVHVWDPLADGRRKGIPTGPDWWPMEVVRHAVEAASHGHATFTVTARCERLPKHAAGVAGQGVK